MQISRLSGHGRLESSRPDAVEAEAAVQARVAAAFEEGIAQGLQQAEAQALERERLRGMSAQQRWDGLLTGLANGVGEIESALADRLLDLTATLAAAIACREITLSNSHIEGVLHESLKLITGTTRSLEITAHPSDCAAIDRWLRPRCADTATLSIRQDPSLTPGGCLLRADDTLLDATLQTRIRRTLGSVGIGTRQADAVAVQALEATEATEALEGDPASDVMVPSPAVDGPAR